MRTVARPSKQTKNGSAARDSNWIKALFIAPAFAFMVIFLLLPIVSVFALMFTEWTGFSFTQIRWAGIDNFVKAANDPVFWKSLLNTLVFVIVTTLMMNVVGLLLALLVSSKVRGHEFVRIAVFLPLAVSPVITAILWQFILGPYGFINNWLKDVGLISTPIEFLGSPDLARWTVLSAAIWQSTGLNFLLFYAALQSLSSERMEAAALDGARYWSRVRWVVLPHLRPVLAVVIVLNLIGGWKVFDLVFILTKGGPQRATEMLSTYLYEQTFDLSRFGYGALLAVVIVTFATVSTLVRRPIMGRETP